MSNKRTEQVGPRSAWREDAIREGLAGDAAIPFYFKAAGDSVWDALAAVDLMCSMTLPCGSKIGAYGGRKLEEIGRHFGLTRELLHYGCLALRDAGVVDALIDIRTAEGGVVLGVNHHQWALRGYQYRASGNTLRIWGPGPDAFFTCDFEPDLIEYPEGGRAERYESKQFLEASELYRLGLVEAIDLVERHGHRTCRQVRRWACRSAAGGDPAPFIRAALAKRTGERTNRRLIRKAAGSPLNRKAAGGPLTDGHG